MIKVIARVKDRELSGQQAIIAVIAGAIGMAVCARLSLHIGFTPVPITAQVFGVLVLAFLLGGKLAAYSQMAYIAAGFAGLPVFSDGHNAYTSILGPNGGYIAGFIPAAFAAGTILQKLGHRSFKNALMAGSFGVLVIYTFGCAWLASWLRLTGMQSLSFNAWLLGALPFIGIDAFKVVMAATINAKMGIKRINS